MRNTIKAALIAFAGLSALATAASAQPYGQDYGDDGYYGDQGPSPYAQQPYGPPPGYGPQGYGAPYDDAYADPYAGYYGSDYGYCDPYYGCPSDFYDLPLYYGSVFYDGAWLNGPFYWRDYGGQRQFWTHGGWHDGNYRGGRFGPALGRSFYAQHNAAGRSFGRAGNFGGQNFARQSYGRSFSGNAWNNRFGTATPGGNAWNNRGGATPGGNAWNNRGFAGRSSFQAQPQAQSFQGRGNWGGWNRQNFQAGGNTAWGGGRGNWGGHVQAQAQPQGGGHSWGGGGGGGGHNWGGGGGGGHNGGGGGDHHHH